MKESESEKNSVDVNELAKIIKELKNKGNFSGVLYAKRNGEIINENIERSINIKEFASMSASILEGAIGLSKTIGSQQIRKIIAELNEETIVIVMTDDKAFIVCILNPESNSSLILEELDEVIQRLNLISIE